MRVLLRRNISKLGTIGDVVEVKPGYARNYLLHHGLAVQPTDANLKAIEAEKEHYLKELAKQKSELEAKAAVVNGKEITIAARANEEGHLYGSIGPAQIAAALAEQNAFIEPEAILLDEPVRQLDKYDIMIRFAEDVTAEITLWVVPVHEDDDEPGEDAEQDAETSADEAPADDED